MNKVNESYNSQLQCVFVSNESESEKFKNVCEFAKKLRAEDWTCNKRHMPDGRLVLTVRLAGSARVH